MYLPLSVALNATSALRDVLVGNTNALSSTYIPSLARRQEALAPPSPAPSMSIVTITSMFTVTSSSIPTTSVNSKPQSSKSSAPTSSVVATSTHSAPLSTSEQPRPSTLTTSSNLPSTTTTPSDSASPTSTETEPTTSTPLASSTSTLPPSSSSSPTNSPPAPSLSSNKRIGLITGLTLGSIISAILLGLLIYWLYALRRGVNVCDCFGGSRNRIHEDQEKVGRHPSVLVPGYDKPLPRRPDMVYPMSGIGAAPRVEWGGEGERGRKLKVQRRPDLGARSGLERIPEI